MPNSISTAGSQRKLKSLVREAVTADTEVLLQVRLWSGAERQAEPPDAAIAMIDDLLAVSLCVARPGRVGAPEAEFADAALAIRAARQLQRLIRGFAEASPMYFLGGCVTLSRVDEEVPAIDIALLTQTGMLTPTKPGQIFLLGKICETARSIPGLQFQALSEGPVDPDEQGSSREALHLLAAAGVDDRPIEFAPELAKPEPAVNSLESEIPAFIPEDSNFARSQSVIERISPLRRLFVGVGLAALGVILFSVFNHKSSPPPSPPSVRPTEANAPDMITTPAPLPPLFPAEVIPEGRRKEKVIAKKTPRSEVSAIETEKEKPNTGALGFTPAEISSLIAKADQDADDGKYDRAIFEYRTVLKSEPGNGQAKEGLARAIRNKGNQ